MIFFFIYTLDILSLAYLDRESDIKYYDYPILLFSSNLRLLI